VTREDSAPKIAGEWGKAIGDKAVGRRVIPLNGIAPAPTAALAWLFRVPSLDTAPPRCRAADQLIWVLRTRPKMSSRPFCKICPILYTWHFFVCADDARPIFADKYFKDPFS